MRWGIIILCVSEATSWTAKYQELKRLGSKDLKGKAVGAVLLAMANEGYSLLWQECDRVSQSTNVAGKTYISFRKGVAFSRPINELLYANDVSTMQLAEQFIMSPLTLTASEATRAAYTVALSVIAVNDVLEIGRKASATFFEILIGHMMATEFQINPATRVTMPGTQVTLPTDYVFDLGQDRPKIHLPVKTSTRERIVQAWVHQLILDRIFGENVYRGMLVCIGETKRNKTTNNVIEICTPNQLKLIQARITKMYRVYYLDPPKPYLDLRFAKPVAVDVRPFGEFFSEVKQLVAF